MTEAGTVGGGKPYSDEDKIHLFLAYFGILSLIPFFMFRDKRTDPQKEFVYWHARQGLALVLCWVVVAIVLGIAVTILGFIPVIGWLFRILGCVVWILVLIGPWIFMILGWVKAFAGQKWQMPGVAHVAEMFK